MNQYSNLEAEQSILGSIIVDNEYINRVAEFLLPEHFYEPANQKIYSQILHIINKANIVANQVTLKQFFENDEIIKELGGANYLVLLLSKASGIIDIRDYAKIVVELWQKRTSDLLLNQALEDLKQKDFGSVSAELIEEIIGLEIQEPQKRSQTAAEILDEIEIEEEQQLTDKFVETGFKKLDEKLNGGLYSQQLIILGARPGIGKTTLAQNIILNAAQAGKKCFFISLEISKKSVMYKFLSNLTSIEYWRFAKKIFRQSDMQSIIRAKQQLRNMKLVVNDSSWLTIQQINQMIKRQIQKEKIDLVVVDYVQIIKGDFSKNRNEASVLKEVTSSLKAIAKQYDVAVLALAQINRQAVQSAKQQPTINDFKGSGGIEEDADVAIVLHRDRLGEDDKETYADTGKLIIVKNRYGQSGSISVDFDGQFNRFVEGEF